jgi:transcriptional pleiotropic repressor
MKKKPLTDKIRQLNGSLYDDDGQNPDLRRAVSSLASIAGVAVFVVRREGEILVAESGPVKLTENMKQLIKDQSLNADRDFMQLLKASEAVYNETDPTQKTNGDYYYSLVPLTAEDKKSDLLLLCSAKKPLDEDQLALAEIGALLIGLIQRLEKSGKEEEIIRNKKLAEGAFESLSYSEVEAIEEILKNITNNESVVIASKIADNLGITRSVIVNALRKFESAGIIESRSLGMKGTFIRVKNLHALEMVANRSFKSGSY